ncbi:MAG: type I polyketide synthase [Chloroflexi bacterium]|nr:type I polyketide synthase [Chloroflexota bacterium]MCC6892491.1 type I polyketide synthase [Anaerolineae bacterium]
MRAKLDQIEQGKTEPIAVIGMACRFPGEANTPDAFWDLLHEGREGVAEMPTDRWDVDSFYSPDPEALGKMISRRGGFLKGIKEFDPQFFGISPREAITLDPQQRLLLETSWEALENAGYAPTSLAESQTGVFVGVSSSEYLQFNLTHENIKNVDPYMGTGGMLSVTAGRIAYVLGLHGPTIALDTACSSSLVTIHMACQSLRSRDCDLALAGGVNIMLMPLANVYLSKMGALAPDGRCKAFSANANGFVRSEGCGMVSLKRLSDAQADGDHILAVIRGTAINHDGRSSGLTAPNGLAQQAVIELAMADAGGLQPHQINYVEAHGTGTPLGDPIEVRALAAVLCKDRPKDNPLMLGSVKTNIGHLESAAGIASFIKTVLALHHKEVPPHLHLDGLNPHIDWENLSIDIPTEPTAWVNTGEPRRAGISAFGFSGTNAHIIVEEAPAQPETAPVQNERPVHILTLSAKAASALPRLAQQYADYLDANPEVAVGDVALTTNVGRSQFGHRAAVVADTHEQLLERLGALKNNETGTGIASGWSEEDNPPKIAFLFTGQGSQYAGMGRELYESQPVFREALDQCAALLDPQLPQPLLSVIYGESELLNDTRYTQPALFALEYTLAILWQSWGIVPSAVMGHSVGEYVAATIAGVFSLEDGLKLIAARGRLMSALPAGGQMVAVLADESVVKTALQGYEQSVSIAAVNTSSQIVISGAGSSIEAIVAKLQSNGIKTRTLTVSHAFHSPLMQPMLKDFEAVASQIRYTPPKIRLISNVTGQAAGAEIATASYWVKHISAPVHFSQAIHTLDQLNFGVYVEVGPGTTLIGMGQQSLPENSAAWLATLRKGQSDWRQVADTLSQLFVHGANVDWKAFEQGYNHKRIPLPTYPFQRATYWNTTASQSKNSRAHSRRASNSAHPLLGQRLPSASRDILFENELSISDFPYIKDHRVFGAIIIPGVTYMELGLAAAREILTKGQYAVENLNLYDPLILTEGSSPLIQVVVSKDNANKASYQVFSLAEDGEQEDSWVLHASGDIRSEQRAVATAEPLANVRATVDQPISLDGYYDHLKVTGPEYGTAFQGMKQLWLKPAEALGYLEATLPSRDTAGYLLHPTFLDACLHPLDGALSDDLYAHNTDIYLPVGLKRLSSYGVVDGDAWSHVRVKAENGIEAIGESFEADIQIYSASGQLVAEIESMYFKRATRESVRRALERRQENVQYEISWAGAPLSSLNQPESSRWLILADREGIGEQLAAHLDTLGNAVDLMHVDESGHVPSVDTLKAAINKQPYQNVAHLWSLDASIADLERAQALSTASLLHTVQAITSAETPARLWVVTQNATANNPAQAATWGLGRVIANEHPEIWGGLIDLQGSKAELDLLTQHLTNPDREKQVVLRDGERLAARLVPITASAETFELPAGERFELDVSERGILENLYIRPAEQHTLEANEVEIRVFASGLNFRDVLNALGMYPGNAGSLGTEAAGVVTAIGETVSHVTIGDEVLVLGNGTFRSHVVVKSNMVFHKPRNLSMAEAVTIPTTFLTAYYGFYRLAHLKAGQRVLIHAAAGGVGLAAVQLALRTGAEIFGTAGSPEKRAFLKSIGVHHVLNSRTLDFADEIMSITNGEGVNVVLNSLAGEFIPKSLSVLANGGCFLEIGKQGVWSPEQVAALNPTLSSYVYDLAEILYTQPGVIQEDLETLLSAAEKGEIQPLPITIFPMQSAIEAFRYMAQAKHTGKVVITQEDPVTIHENATYLITGGLGGIGLKVAQRFADAGAKHLVLMGRRVPSHETQELLETLRQKGIEIVIAQGDVSQMDDLARMFDDIQHHMPPLRGIIHSAGSIDDGMLNQQTWSRFERILAPKIQGSWNLHTLTKSTALDFFIMFSSVASVMGSAGQGNYAAANAFMDTLAAHRRSQGLPGLSINWGAWSEVGMASAMDTQQQQRLIDQGLNFISPEQGLSTLEQLLDSKRSQIVVMPVNWQKLMSQFREVPPLLSAFEQLATEKGATVSKEIFINELRQTEAEQRQPTLLGFVREQVVKVLGLNATQIPDDNQELIQIGMDSLMAVELSNRFRTHFERPFATTLAFEQSNITALSNYLYETVVVPLFADAVAETNPNGSGAVDDMDAAQLLSNIDNLSDEDVENLLRQMQAEQGSNP